MRKKVVGDVMLNVMNNLKLIFIIKFLGKES